MASASTMMKRMELSFGRKGPLSVVLEGGVGFGASVAIGEIYHRYGHEHYAAKHVARISAIAGKVGAIAASMFMGPGAITGTLDAIGQAGLNAVGLDIGLRHARKSSGKKAILVPDSTDVKKLPGAEEMTALGALGKARAGRGMTWAQIEEIASGH